MSRRVTKMDFVAIQLLISSVPAIDHRIIQLSKRRDGTVAVTTGVLAGPECGEGHSLLVEKKDGRWTLQPDSIQAWIA